MSDPLAALIAREGLLSAGRLDDALQRQVLDGGTLDSALLALDLVDEDTLLAWLGRAHQARAVGKSELVGVAKEVVALFPRRLAEKHNLAPVELTGRRLTVAATRTLDPNLLDEIGFMLSVYVRQAITTEARLQQAQHRMYGTVVPPRVAGLLAQLGDPVELQQPPRATAASAIAASDGSVAAPAAPATATPPAATPPAATPPPPERTPWLTHQPAQVPASTSPPPIPSRAARGLQTDPTGWTVASSLRPDAKTPAPTPSLVPQPAPAATVDAASTFDVQQAAHAKDQALAALQREEQQKSAAEDKRRRDRVLWTVDDAIAELALADARDELLDVVLRFAYRRLRTAGIFILQRAPSPVFVGWDLIDPLLTKADAHGFTIDAAGGHALGTVWEMKSPFLGPIAKDDPLTFFLGRTPRAVVLLPLLVGDHLVGVIYGDCGERAIPPSLLAELHMVVPRLTTALGNLILRARRAARAPAAAAPVASIVDAQQGATLKSIELDISEVDISVDGIAPVVGEVPALGDAAAFEAPEALSADAAPTPAAPAVVSRVDTRRYADDEGEEEDVALDAASLRSLEPAPPPPAMDLRAAEAALGGIDAPRPDRRRYADDEGDEEDVELDEASVRALIAETAPPLRRQTPPPPPAATELPRASEPSPPEPETPAAPQKPRLVAVPSVPSDDPSPWTTAAFAPSPGRSARESLLLATHNEWLEHDDPEADERVGRMHQPTPQASEAAIKSVMALGERALPSLSRYFPGVLAVHPFGDSERERPDVAEFSDCCACLVALGADHAAPILTAELAHEDRLHRYAATWALSQLIVPAALPRLVQRVFDPELRIAQLALEVLPCYRDAPGGADAWERVIGQLRDLLRRGDEFQRERALFAVSELKDTGALVHLTDLLGTRPKELAELAHRALVEITKQDFGGAERRWRAWIADNQGRNRLAWLIDGLGSKDAAIRKGAQEELNHLTGQFFGYRHDAARAEREQAQLLWQQWYAEREQRRAQGLDEATHNGTEGGARS